MKEKDNADRLADSLRERGFPAFVSHKRTDRFYRVMIGPYDGVGAASRIKERLKKQNLEAIIRRQRADLDPF
jgi:cell division septation protein DedD